MVERLNQTFESLLKVFVNQKRNDWDLHLPYLLLAYRATPHAATGITPAMAMLGRELKLPADVAFGTGPSPQYSSCPVMYVHNLRHNMSEAFELARQNLHKSARTQKEVHDSAGCMIRKYNPGDLVFRFYPPTANQKLGKSYKGPYKVIQMIDDHTIKICDDKKDLVVHAASLKPFKKAKPAQQ